jgi:hypothetical protein
MKTLRLAAACWVVLAATPALANLITNGSFEAPLVPAGSTATYPGGSTAITGWTVVGVDSSLVSGSFMQSGITFQAQDGQQWLDLAGFTSNSMTSGVTQDIATTPFQIYEVSFYVGSATDGGFFFPTSVDLSIDGGARVRFTNPIAPSNMLNWQQFTVPFLATQSSTNITFYNGGASNNFLSALDNVVIEGITEPAGIIVGLIGFLNLFAWRWRRETQSLN